MWVILPSDGQYGRVNFGISEKYPNTAEGGLNECGLFIGVNSLNPKTNWQANPDLPAWEEWEGWYGTGVPDGILAKCATVEEAISICRKHNLFVLDNAKYLLADKTGASAIVEWSAEGLQIVRREGDYQISTNFVNSNYAADDIPCYRYKLAEKLLRKSGREPVDLLRGVLSATHMEMYSPTVYSYICNLTTGDIQVYYFHNYEHARKLNIYELISGEAVRYTISELVGVVPFSTVYYR
jgi:hypothetical protein